MQGGDGAGPVCAAHGGRQPGPRHAVGQTPALASGGLCGQKQHAVSWFLFWIQLPSLLTTMLTNTFHL